MSVCTTYIIKLRHRHMTVGDVVHLTIVDLVISIIVMHQEVSLTILVGVDQQCLVIADSNVGYIDSMTIEIHIIFDRNHLYLIICHRSSTTDLNAFTTQVNDFTALKLSIVVGIYDGSDDAVVLIYAENGIVTIHRALSQTDGVAFVIGDILHLSDLYPFMINCWS